MHTRKADAPRERITILPPERVTDSESNTVPTGDLNFGPTTTSDADGVLIENDSPEGFDLVYGKPLDDGTPRTCTITCPITVRESGAQIGAYAEVIVITAGDPVNFVGGGFTFANDPPPAPPE